VPAATAVGDGGEVGANTVAEGAARVTSVTGIWLAGRVGIGERRSVGVGRCPAAVDARVTVELVRGSGVH
jgi:hypothetical protein